MNYLNADQIATLTKVDSPTIANVIELFDIRSYVAGYANHTLKALYPELPPVAGYAVTATFRSAFPATATDSYGGMAQLIQESQALKVPKVVVVQDLDEPPRAAAYGEMMATAFQTFGFAGLITNGAGRDVEQVKRLQFPCWVSSVLVAHGYCRLEGGNTPVNVGGLQVRPGDLIHADGNGIISIPHSIAAAVVELCEPFIQAEQIVLDYLRSPQPTVAGYSDALKKMRGVTAQLRERARASVEKQVSH